MKSRKSRKSYPTSHPRWAIVLALIMALQILSHPDSSVRAEPMYALTDSQQLIYFDSANPTSLITSHFVQGLQPGEQLLAIDYRSATGEIMGLGSHDNLYVVSQTTGFATLVGGGSFSAQLNGISFGMDIDPVSDLIRVVSNLGQNITIRPNDGVVVDVGGTLSYDPSDFLSGRRPNIKAIAYQVGPGGTDAKLFLLDSLQNTLAVEDSQQSGLLHTEALVNIFNLRNFNAFDISQGTGTAYAAVDALQDGLYQIDLESGIPIFVGTIGEFNDDLIIRGLTVVPEPGHLLWLGLGAVGAFHGLRRRFRA